VATARGGVESKGRLRTIRFNALSSSPCDKYIHSKYLKQAWEAGALVRSYTTRVHDATSHTVNGRQWIIDGNSFIVNLKNETIVKWKNERVVTLA
jgi:hypothetical protein